MSNTGAHYTRAWIQINVDSWNLVCIYMVNRRSRFASVPCVVFEDATLKQCDFYAQSLLVPFCANCCFHIMQHTHSYLRSVGIQIDLDSRNWHRSGSMLSCSKPHCIFFHNFSWKVIGLIFHSSFNWGIHSIHKQCSSWKPSSLNVCSYY